MYSNIMFVNSLSILYCENVQDGGKISFKVSVSAFITSFNMYKRFVAPTD